jgi:hypothetical protein
MLLFSNCFYLFRNPTYDLQAQDRCYRYGQLKKVRVFRLIAQGTVEELVYMRQLYKQELSKTVIPQESQLTQFDSSGSHSTSKRTFEGIQGDSNAQGELFGLHNLLQYEDGSILVKLRDKYSTRTKEESKLTAKNNLSPQSNQNISHQEFDTLKIMKHDEFVRAMSNVPVEVEMA